MHGRFRFRNSLEILKKASELGLDLPFTEDFTPLFRPATINGKILDNRFTVQPMEGYDSEPDGSPSQLTERRYLRYARGGSAMVWFEAIAVRPDGRSNARQLMITENNAASFETLIRRVREDAVTANPPFLVAQVTHSGRYSRPDGTQAPLVPQANPLLDKGNPVILSDRDLMKIQDDMVNCSRLAWQAGFDAVDIKACHGYLVDELLSSVNRKDSFYGGREPEKRFRFLLETLERINARVPGLILTTRLNICDLYSGGFGCTPDGKSPDLTEPVMLIGKLAEQGIELVNITMGSPYFNPYVVRPFDTALPGGAIPDEHPLEGVMRMISNTSMIQHRFPGLLIVGSGYSWLRQFAPNTGSAVIKAGGASFMGLGRSSFAYPSLPADLKTTGRADPRKVCTTCSGCSRLINNLLPGGCVTRDREIYGTELKKLTKYGK